MDKLTELKTTFNWITSDHIEEKHKNIKINQVYCWILTKDKKIILVSKDGQKWQFPGGHPEAGESIIQAGVREIHEEAGLAIEKPSDLSFFGYYIVSEPNEERSALREILQVRLCLVLEQNSDELKLGAKEKDTEAISERINFVETLTLEEVNQKIPWLEKSEELLAFKNKVGL